MDIAARLRFAYSARYPFCRLQAAVSAFGCGYFDDAGDIPGQLVLMYMLRGEWQPAEPAGAGGAAGAGGGSLDGGVVSLEKQYTAPELFGVGPMVRYDGRLVRRASGRCLGRSAPF